MSGEASSVARWGVGLDESLSRDAWSSDWAWSSSTKWGGRSRGGRGVKAASLGGDISIDRVEISFDGKELLANASIKLEQKHRYALIGENGSGKSTLLRRMALGAIPGWPSHIRTIYLQQEDARATDASLTVLDYILQETEELERLKLEEAALEAFLEGGEDEDELVRLTEALCAVVDRIEGIEAGARKTCTSAKERLELLPAAERDVIKGLGLGGLVPKACILLSGGQRTRCALARALLAVQRGECDLLLLDECTNHLDATHTDWLQSHLTSITSCAIVAVSHDEAFLSEICTAVMVINADSHTLSYFPGAFEAFVRNSQEMASFNEGRLDSQHRKEAHIEKSLQFAREKGLDSTIRNKEKKLQRAALSARADGKKFKLFSLKFLDESALRLPDVVSASKKSTRLDHPLHFDAARIAPTSRARLVAFRFPEPPDLRNDSRPIVTLDKCQVGWGATVVDPPILNQLTLELHMGDRIALVGRNGCGKTTLLTALALALKSTGPREGVGAAITGGTLHIEAAVAAGFVGQQHIDGLAAFLDISPLAFLHQMIAASETRKSWSDLELRTHLGKFALGGEIALQVIGSLSGGEKARLAMAAATLHSPHVLILDEPTNHLSPASLSALRLACTDFQGAIVFSSHSAAFVEAVATQTLELKGGLAVRNTKA